MPIEGVAILICLPVLMALTFYILLQLMGEFSKCPSCSAEISGHRLKKGLQCPDCGFTEMRTDEPAAPIESGAFCHLCNGNLSDVELLALWDGKSYCHDCVGAQSPALLEMAQQSDHYQEKIQLLFWDAVRIGLPHTVLVLLVLTTLLGLIVLVASLGSLTATTSAQHFILIVIGIPILLWYAWQWRRYPREIGVVTIRNGCLMLQREKVIVQDVVLADCVWFFSSESAVCANNYGPVSKHSEVVVPGPAIVIRIPSDWYNTHTGQVVVGTNDESLEVWRSFLTLAGLPQCDDGALQWQWFGYPTTIKSKTPT